jgi:beta-lactamase regulating signal transducer with metallopeptidase domain
MWFDSSLAGLSTWITYCVQVAFAYLTTLCICAFVQNPRTRVRIWGCFLFLTIASWLLLLVPTQASCCVPSLFGSALLQPKSSLHVILPVKNVLASYFARLAPVARIIYLFLLLISLLHLLLKSLHLRAVLGRTQKPSPQLRLLFRRLCIELGIRHSELSLVSDLRSPATCYWRRSHVLFPTELVPQLDSDQLADVLRHELIHVKQHDYLWDRLAALGCRLVFFHPLIWLAYRRLRWERELACDHKVVEERAEARLAYAECLTRLARWFVEESRLSEGIGFSSPESLLAIRVRALLSEPSSYSNSQKAARVALILTMTAIALFVVSSFGLSLSPPAPLSALFRSRNARIDFTSGKTQKLKTQHPSRDKSTPAESLWKLTPSEPQGFVALFLDARSTSLPVLRESSTVVHAPSDSGSMSSEKASNGTPLHAPGPAWDEAPMPLASPPKWRKLVVGAITGVVAVASGRVDVDDVDGPPKRGR